MSGHHGHHRSSHQSRSRMHGSSSSSHYNSSHRRPRTSSSNTLNDGGGDDGGGGAGGSSNQRIPMLDRESSTAADWQECKSSSGKVYYYNRKSGVSQWEVPSELRQQQRPASPDSEMSESSSIRQQKENSPSSSASTNPSVRSDPTSEDKPLLTPGLEHYFEPKFLTKPNSQTEELERLSMKHDREVQLLDEQLLEARVKTMLSRINLEFVTTQAEAAETKCIANKMAIKKFDIPNYQ